jgi:hypothetical protein
MIDFWREVSRASQVGATILVVVFTLALLGIFYLTGPI